LTKYDFSMRKRILKKYDVNGQGMTDVELVDIMEDALKSPKSHRYEVKVDNIRWDLDYKKAWANHIKTIEHWNSLTYYYSETKDRFVFYKK